MRTILIAAPVPCPIAWPGEPAAPQRGFSPGGLRGLFTAWEERKRFRWDLARMAADNPHLIEDIGMTRRQLELEIAKPFWRA